MIRHRHPLASGRLASGQAVGTLAAALCLVTALGVVQPARAQTAPTAQMLIGKAVSDDDQAGEVTNAINRFLASDIDGASAILERVKSNNAKLPPPGVMMSMLWSLSFLISLI